jgi:hypothetical protein
VKKGVPEEELEQTVNDAMEEAAPKEPTVKRSSTRTSASTRKTPASTARVQDEDLD